MGTSSNKTRRIIAVGAALAATLGLSPSPASAASFTTGDVVVCRVGSGTGSLINTGSPVFLDEYTPGGVLVQSIPMTPSGANAALIASGTATSECMITRSTDGRFVIVTGYGTTMPTTGLSGSASTAVPRIIGRVDANGVVDTSTASSGTTRVATVGSGLPTTAGQAISNLPGTPTTASPYGIFAADLDATPGIDTMYVADDTSGTITKYSLVGSNWVGSATTTIAAAGVRGLTGTVSGSTLTLFASTGGSTATGVETLWSIADSAGYNAAPSSTVPTSIAMAAANSAFRGVALAPNATVLPLVPESPLPVVLPLAGIVAIGGWSLNRRRNTHPVTAA